MYDGMLLYRAIVNNSSSVTGDVYVRIPNLLGSDNSIALSKVTLSKSGDTWLVPEVGAQVLVAVEDKMLSSVHLVTSPQSSTGLSGQDLSLVQLHASSTAGFLDFQIAYPGTSLVYLRDAIYDPLNMLESEFSVVPPTGLYFYSITTTIIAGSNSYNIYTEWGTQSSIYVMNERSGNTAGAVYTMSGVQQLTGTPLRIKITNNTTSSVGFDVTVRLGLLTADPVV